MVDLDLKPGSVSAMSTDMYIECAKEKLRRLKSEIYDLQKHIEELTKKQELKLNKTIANAKKEEDPLIGKYILTEEGTVGKVVYKHTEYQIGYTVYTGDEKVYQFYDEDYVQENLLGEVTQTLISDKNIGEDIVDIMIGKTLDTISDMLQEYAQENDIELPTPETQEREGNYCYYQPGDIENPNSAREYIRNKAYEAFYENKIVVSENKVARICAYLQTPEGEDFFKVKTNLGECSWESKDWIDTHIADTTLDEIYDKLQQYPQENGMEFPSDEKDELIGRYILFDDCTIGRIVGTTQTATYNKAYKICDSLEPLNIQVRDEDFVKGSLIDESLEKYLKDEHLGRDFTGVMFQELSNAVREQMRFI